MLSREAADMFEAKGTGCLPGRHIIFAGLDDLPASQLRLMKALKGLMAPDSKPVADFFWDAPGTPLSPESDIDAGAQFQILKEKFPCSHPGFDNYVKNCTFPPRLEVIACPGNSVQTKVAGRLLEQIAAEEEGQVSADMARVAVVLPDEGLLFPMYSAVPEAVAKNVNVTMGYPIRSTSASSFVSHLRKLQMLNRRIKVRTLFHNEEVRLLLAHPFVQQILGVQTVEKIQGYLLTNRLFYLDAEDMLEALGGEEKQKAGEQLKILSLRWNAAPRAPRCSPGCASACCWPCAGWRPAPD